MIRRKVRQQFQTLLIGCRRLILAAEIDGLRAADRIALRFIRGGKIDLRLHIIGIRR